MISLTWSLFVFKEFLVSTMLILGLEPRSVIDHLGGMFLEAKKSSLRPKLTQLSPTVTFVCWIYYKHTVKYFQLKLKIYFIYQSLTEINSAPLHASVCVLPATSEARLRLTLRCLQTQTPWLDTPWHPSSPMRNNIILAVHLISYFFYTIQIQSYIVFCNLRALATPMALWTSTLRNTTNINPLYVFASGCVSKLFWVCCEHLV